MWHFTFLPFLIFLFIYVELFHFWKTFKAYNTVLSDKNRNGILEYVSFCDKYFCLFYFSLVKQNQIWHCTGKKTGEKMLHCLTHPSCNLYKINLWKKSVVRLPFFPCYPVFYISNFPPLPYPLKCPPIYYSNDPLRTFRRNQNAKFKICEWKRNDDD